MRRRTDPTQFAADTGSSVRAARWSYAYAYAAWRFS
jgi:hypothetical protein